MLKTLKKLVFLTVFIKKQPPANKQTVENFKNLLNCFRLHLLFDGKHIF